MRRSIYIFSMLLVLAGLTSAQRIIKIAPGVDDIIATTIKADSVARTAALPATTVYELQRDGIYNLVSIIENNGFYLYIRAASGTGYKPFLISKENAAAKVAQAINFRFNGKLEGLTIDQTSLAGIVGNRLINVYAGASVWFKNCEIMHDRGGIIAIQSDSCSVYMDDCFVHSSGHPKSMGGNGRVIDIRPTVIQDTIIVRNTTFFNMTDRILRNMGTVVNYMKFDHNTSFTTQGYHGGLQAGKTKELVITNNIFYNVIADGSWKTRTAPFVNEQSQPENTRMYVVTLDTSYLVPNPKVTVRNNDVWWDKKYTDLWVKYKDSTTAPGIFTPTIMKKLGADSTKAYTTEELVFQAPPPSIYNFIDSSFQFPNSLTLPQNWLFTYQEADGMSPVNGSYPTTAKAYTGGDNALPIGDLNWFPTKKTAWLLTDVKTTAAGIPENYSLSQNYPNPFNPSTTFTFAMSKAGFVTLSVYDILGREVASLINNVAEAGTHSVTWNAAGMTSGVYFYKMQTGSFTSLKKMILVK